MGEWVSRRIGDNKKREQDERDKQYEIKAKSGAYSLRLIAKERIEEMKKLMMVVLGMVFAVGMGGMAMAGNIDSPGAPSAGSGIYTLQNLYDYLTSGTALAVSGSFQEPAADPSSTMKTIRQIGDDTKALFDQCEVVASDVKSGKKFFCTQAGNWGVQTGTMAAGGGLLKTGQTSVYKTNDDGTYQKGKAFNYSWESGTNTVKDNVTGLIWASSGTGAGCRSGSTIGWSSAIIWAEALNFGGRNDWRLPNVAELQTLSVRDSSLGLPFLNKTYFPGYASGAFWTSTTSLDNTAKAFTATNSFGGSTDPNTKTAGAYVRAVCGGE